MSKLPEGFNPEQKEEELSEELRKTILNNLSAPSGEEDWYFNKNLDRIFDLRERISPEKFQQKFKELIGHLLVKEWGKTVANTHKFAPTSRIETMYKNEEEERSLKDRVRKKMLNKTIETWLKEVLPILNRLEIPKDFLGEVMKNKQESDGFGKGMDVVDKMKESGKVSRDLATGHDAYSKGEYYYDYYDFDLRKTTEETFKEKLNEIIEKEEKANNSGNQDY